MNVETLGTSRRGSIPSEARRITSCVARIHHIQSLADPVFAPFALDYAGVKERQLAAMFGPLARSGSPDAPHGKLYAEGPLVLQQLVRSAHRTLSVLTTQLRLATIEAELALLPPEVPVFVVPQDVMDGVVGFNMHRGLLAVAARAQVPPLETFLTAAAAHPGPLVIAEDLANHDNVGAIFRNAAAFNASGVLLTPACADPLYRKAIRVSSGHALRLPWAWAEPWPEAIGLLHRAGWKTLAMTPRGEMTLNAATCDAPATQRFALVIGAEGPGLASATLSACSHRVRLDMAPGVDSLNAAVAGAIGLYELTRPRS